MKAVLGIDPGASGAVVLIDERCQIQYTRFKLGWELTASSMRIYAGYDIKDCIIEHVHAMPRDQRKHAFTFGENTGIIKGILYANNITFRVCDPKKWQFHHAVGGRWAKECKHVQPPNPPCRPCEYAAKQRKYAEKAGIIFPTAKITQDLAAAVLIAKYCWDQNFTLDKEKT